MPIKVEVPKATTY